MRNLLIAVALWRTCSVSGESPFLANADLRRLEDVDGNSYAYLDDLTPYSMRFGKCVRVKIPQENDNDDDGNVYFYNNRYHAPSMAHASFFLCNSDSGDSCGTCDTSTEYVMEVETYLQYEVQIVQNYCGDCAAQCRRRRLEDEEDEEQGEEEDGDNEDGGFCSTCVDQCSLYLAGNEGNDETNYLECQEAYEDENEVQYYSGPGCTSEGTIGIGLYYDEDCTIKAQQYENDFAFNTFGTIEKLCYDCNEGNCGNFYQQSYHCVDGYDQNGYGGDDDDDDDDEDLPVCKTYKRASKEWTYATATKKNKVVPIVILIVVLGAIAGICSFLSYTYYVRHKNSSKTPMASLDNDATVPSEELPPVS